MRQDARARITLKKSWGSYHLFRLESADIAREAEPGQFLMVRVSDTPDPLLRRPISLHDRDGASLEIFFQVAGRGTALLAERKEGETLDIIGPLGKGFDLAAARRSKSALLVGGGRGIAPLFFLGRELQAKGLRVHVFYGGKTAADLPVRKKFEEAGLNVTCSTDDGSFGFHGFVTGLLEAEIRQVKPDHLFVCGPDPMMEKTAKIALAHKIPAQISLEAIMGCGFGACWGCVKRIRSAEGGAWRKICEDGPVFPAEDILWEETA
jgi:dihydroorotate dehydrogenase electron transfer subunit